MQIFSLQIVVTLCQFWSLQKCSHSACIIQKISLFFIYQWKKKMSCLFFWISNWKGSNWKVLFIIHKKDALRIHTDISLKRKSGITTRLLWLIRKVARYTLLTYILKYGNVVWISIPNGVKKWHSHLHYIPFIILVVDWDTTIFRGKTFLTVSSLMHLGVALLVCMLRMQIVTYI